MARTYFSVPRFALTGVVVLIFAALAFACAGCGSGNGLHDDDPAAGKTARCVDGSYSSTSTPDISCASHGGTDYLY